jgi:hypothetical protein
MLRWVMGDDNFQTPDGLSREIPKHTRLDRVRKTVNQGGDLNYFFDQWLNSSGVRS